MVGNQLRSPHKHGPTRSFIVHTPNLESSIDPPRRNSKESIPSYQPMASPESSPPRTPTAASTSPPALPYPSAARISDSMCFPQYSASLKSRIFDLGLEANQEKSNCQQFFDDYKECKKKEREARLERNSKRSFFS
ncbi:Cox19 family protein (CHCH motif) [Rhynchospora pubera]|uniref:Cox19 family protein (CHCH motif) n=1 Tax=Rhynchospora pubera TaxID=906938 RepID=A0AAV8E743_9POAL|nr:Cox19 family protein (CHCH motif) [Rhynchospora pubera]